MTALGTLLRPLFRVSAGRLPAGARRDPAAEKRLREVVVTVTECCQLTLLTSRQASLVPRLDRYPEELRGFAYEGAGVGLAALDHWLPNRRRTREFVDGPGAPYIQAVYLGAGMGLARLKRDPARFLRRLDDDLFKWVVLDGYGFHEGFFRHRRYIGNREMPSWASGYAGRAFDHGVGRSIWFGSGADVGQIHSTIAAFPQHRHGDLWAGIGLACGYTGGVDAAAVRAVRDAAGPHHVRLAEGVVVAARARHQVGNAGENVETACTVICGMSSQEAAEISDAALNGLSTTEPHDGAPAYEVWRRRLGDRVFAQRSRNDG